MEPGEITEYKSLKEEIEKKDQDEENCGLVIET